MKSHCEGRAGVSDPGCSRIPAWEGLGTGGKGGVTLSEGRGAEQINFSITVFHKGTNITWDILTLNI